MRVFQEKAQVVSQISDVVLDGDGWSFLHCCVLDKYIMYTVMQHMFINKIHSFISITNKIYIYIKTLSSGPNNSNMCKQEMPTVHNSPSTCTHRLIQIPHRPNYQQNPTKKELIKKLKNICNTILYHIIGSIWRYKYEYITNSLTDFWQGQEIYPFSIRPRPAVGSTQPSHDGY